MCFVFSITSSVGSRLTGTIYRLNCKIREDEMIAISNPIGGALLAELAKQTRPDVV